MAEETGYREQQEGAQGTTGYLARRFGAGFEKVTGVRASALDYDDGAAKIWLLSSVIWFIVVTTFGMIIAIELYAPEVFRGISWLVFSRVRPNHVQGVIFCWLTMMYFGAIFYMLPRLLGTKTIWSEGLGYWTAWFYNFVLAVGIVSLLAGHSQGREYAEWIWIVDIGILLTFLSNIVNILGTVAIRTVRPLYVTVWWSMAAPAWVFMSIAIENVVWLPGPHPFNNPSGALPTPIHDVLINWWGNHNLFGLWLTPMLVAVTYYVVVRITNTPLYSHTLSLISFWGLIFTYVGVGDHHLLQTPTPGWLKTIASVNSVGILIPVFAFFINVFLTMRGNWDKFFTNLPLRFVMTGFVFYILVNIQGALQSIQPFNVVIHFSNFIIGHSHLALLGGFTILGMGVIYHMVPNMWGKPPYSRVLVEWQYWLVTLGFSLFFTSLTIVAFIQGQGWQNGLNEVNVLPMLTLWNEVRAVAGSMIWASAWLQAISIILTAVVATRVKRVRQGIKDAKTALPQGTT